MTPVTRRRTNAEYVQAWRARNPLAHKKIRVLMNALWRAKKLGLPYALKVKDLRWPTVCPVLGIPINYANTGKHPHDSSPSLDRINPALGYTAGNVMVISFRANKLKSDCVNGDELRRVAAYIDLWGYYILDATRN